MANTKEVLYLVNRPANVPIHKGAAVWIDRAIDLVKDHAGKILLRGDTDFSLTANFDRWSKEVDFIFGMDAHAKLVERAEELPETSWKEFHRPAKYIVKTQERPETAVRLMLALGRELADHLRSANAAVGRLADQ